MALLAAELLEELAVLEAAALEAFEDDALDAAEEDLAEEAAEEFVWLVDAEEVFGVSAEDESPLSPPPPPQALRNETRTAIASCEGRKSGCEVVMICKELISWRQA